MQDRSNLVQHCSNMVNYQFHKFSNFFFEIIGTNLVQFSKNLVQFRSNSGLIWSNIIQILEITKFTHFGIFWKIISKILVQSRTFFV